MAYSSLFLKVIKVILQNEGGYVNHPSDPGGETNMGITKRNYPDLNIKCLTKEKAISIYYNDYWLPMKLDILNDEDLILQVFDMGVNAGPKTSIKLLQRLVGVPDDGLIGLKTVRAVSEFDGDILTEYMKRRKLYYVTLVQKKEQLRPFLKGWISRVEHCKFTP
jgi:lysozyme family protein